MTDPWSTQQQREREAIKIYVQHSMRLALIAGEFATPAQVAEIKKAQIDLVDAIHGLPRDDQA